MILDKWQEEIKDYDGNILLAKGRRIGATYIFAEKAVEHLRNNHNTHPSSQIICVSLTEDQAELIIAFSTNYAKKNCPELIGKGKNKPTLRRLILVVNKNRRILLARPVGATGDSVRGFEGQVLMVDEAPKMPKLFWASATPALATTGGKIWAWGTFFGADPLQYFWKNYKKCKRGEGRFKLWERTTPEVFEARKISEDWTEEIRKKAFDFLEEEKEEMSKREFAQEYLAIASVNLMQFFPDKLIRGCMTLKRRDSILPNRRYYLGVDVARMGEDESTFEIIDRTNKDALEHVEHQIIKHELVTAVGRHAIGLDKIWDFKQIFIDDGGIGQGAFDTLLDHDLTKRKSIAINSSSRPLDNEGKRKKKVLKENIFNNLLVLMEQAKIKFLVDEKIFQSLKSVQFEYVDGKMKIFGNYAHIADGLVRAAWCSKDKSLNIWIR